MPRRAHRATPRPHTLQDEINLLVSQLPGVIEQFNARPLHPATEQSHAHIRRAIDLRFDLTQLRRPVSPARCVERLFAFRREQCEQSHDRP